MRRTSPAGSAEGGFTLLELLVVMVLMALIMGVVVPRLRSPRDLGPEAAARALAGELRLERSRALAERRPILVSLQAIADRVPLEGAWRLEDAAPQGVLFFPDGTSSGGRLINQTADRRLVFEVDWLTGRVRRVDG